MIRRKRCVYRLGGSKVIYWLFCYCHILLNSILHIFSFLISINMYLTLAVDSPCFLLKYTFIVTRTEQDSMVVIDNELADNIIMHYKNNEDDVNACD